MIITPNTALITEDANPATAARFPSCMHFWQCKETSGTSLADAMGRATLTGASSMTFGSNYVVPNVAVASPGSVTGALEVTGTSPIMLITVAEAGGNGFQLGVSGTDIINVIRAATSVITDATTGGGADTAVTAFTTLGAGVVGARAVVVKSFSGNLQGINYDCSLDTYTAAAEAATTQSVTLSSQMSAWACPNTVVSLYGAALFKFTTIPSDAELKSIISWCAYYWSRGYKTLPPWLVGRT